MEPIPVAWGQLAVPGQLKSSGDCAGGTVKRHRGTTPGQARGRMVTQQFREFLARAGLVLVGLAAALGLLEVGLQAASMFFHARVAPVSDVGRHTVLTLGDSHTYGLNVEESDSYPGRLAALLEARAAGRYAVVNLGLPGTNSSEIVTRLPDWLARFSPRDVVVCVGVNNIWNRSDADAVGNVPALVRALDGLRLVRFWRLLRDRFRARRHDGTTLRPDVERRVLEKGAVEFRDAGTGNLLIRHEGSPFNRRPLEEALAVLRRDLRRIHELVTERGSRLALLTYAEFPVGERMSWGQRNQVAVNEELRRFAVERDVLLIDAGARVGQLLADGASASTYFDPDASHLNVTGYAVVSALVADVFVPTSPAAPVRQR